MIKSVKRKIVKNKEKETISGTKLEEILKSLSIKEYKKFGLFINSPFFNKSRIIKDLYSYFKSIHRKNKIESVTRVSIFKAIYGQRKYNEVLLRKQLSLFLNIAEEFLLQNEFNSSTALRKNIMLGISVRRKLKSTFDKTLKELDSYYILEPDKDSEFYQNYLNTQRIKYEREASSLRSPEESIKNLSFSLDLFFLSLKLLYYYDILNLRIHFNKNIEFDMWAFDDISRLIESNKMLISEDHPAIFADYLSVQMLLHPADNEHYSALIDFVKTHRNKLGRSSLHKMYVILYNHNVYRLNRGFVKDNKELFETIKIIENENVPIWNYFAFHIYYVNAVTNAARQGQFEWAEEFINKRKNLIKEDIRDETNSLALANLFFTKRDYDKALKYLVNVDYPNYSYYLMAKDMMIKIYWERTEREGVLSAIDAMRKFLQRKDLIPQRLNESYTNFINCVSRMVEPDKKNLAYEVNKLLEKEMISADKNWIKEKLKEYKKL